MTQRTKTSVKTSVKRVETPGHGWSNQKQNETGCRLLSCKSCPQYRRRDFILSGYREEMSTGNAIKTLFSVHNQTGNIYTHLIGFLLFSVLVPLDASERTDVFQSTADVVFFWLFYTTVCIMLLLSIMYHIFECVSSSVEARLYSCDIVGISLSVMCICFLNIWYIFRCASTLKVIFFIVCGTTASQLAAVALTNAKDWSILLKAFWGITIACFSLVTGVLAFRHSLKTAHMWQGDGPMWGVVMSITMITAGSYLFNYRVPEAWFPGTVDIWGHSHQFWHVFVILAPVSTYIGIISCEYRPCP